MTCFFKRPPALAETISRHESNVVASRVLSREIGATVMGDK